MTVSRMSHIKVYVCCRSLCVHVYVCVMYGVCVVHESIWGSVGDVCVCVVHESIWGSVGVRCEV